MPPKRKSLASLKERSKSSPIRSVTQPPELSNSERSKITAYLDSTDKPFKVATLPATRKRKRESGVVQIQQSAFEDRLAVQYEVTPGTTWDSLRRYKKFTVVAESIAVGECILVSHDAPESQVINVHEQWKAQVLDVRALDPEHVYVRVAWLNRPEDLDTGRKPYHGKNELIPTNQIDIIDATSVNGKIDLVHWEENQEDQARLEEDQFFWRQTFDYATTQTFSVSVAILFLLFHSTPIQTNKLPPPATQTNLHRQCAREPGRTDPAMQQSRVPPMDAYQMHCGSRRARSRQLRQTEQDAIGGGLEAKICGGAKQIRPATPRPAPRFGRASHRTARRRHSRSLHQGPFGPDPRRGKRRRRRTHRARRHRPRRQTRPETEMLALSTRN
nr:hypothetical protein CFP56_66175 [Quercus suber]